MAAPKEFLSYIDAHADAFIERLAEAVAIPSISGEPERRPEVLRMAAWLEAQLKALGVETKTVELGTQSIDKVEYALPPAVLGRIGDDKDKKTVLIYGHFDVQPVRAARGDRARRSLICGRVGEQGRRVGHRAVHARQARGRPAHRAW
jgi:Cys-Gly metallodipeptidase DUG1